MEEEARAWFKRLEEVDKEATELWKLFRELSLKEFMAGVAALREQHQIANVVLIAGVTVIPDSAGPRGPNLSLVLGSGDVALLLSGALYASCRADAMQHIANVDARVQKCLDFPDPQETP